MSVSCTTSPTATSTNVLTTVSETTTTSLSTTISPPETLVTFSLVPCTTTATILGIPVTCPPSPVPYTTTIPGATQTVQVPFTLTSTITSTSLTTLFGSSCTTINTDSPPTPQPQPSTPSVTPTPSSPSPSITQSTTTQPNGSVVIQTIIVTPSPSNTIAADDHDGSSPDFAPIVGGTVGGFFGLIAIVALIWFILRRRRRWDDIFEREENEIIAAGARGRPARFSLDVDPEPKPYQYGLIGKAMAPSASPPNSPSMRPSAGTGNIHHARHSSLTPLNPVTASNATLSSSRPSTGGSQQPLYPPQQGYTQGYVPPLPQHQPTIDYASGPSTLTHNHSASTASFTSAPVSHAHWGNGVGPGYNDSIGTAMMGLGSPVMIPDETDRSGTPTSYQEPRRLQVTNAIPSEFDFEFGESSSSAAAAAAAAAVPLRDGKGRLVTRTPVQPIVHVDGGRVELNNQPAVAPPSASGPLPPAYAN